MAKYTVTHICGHTKIHQIYGTNSNGERDHKIEWLKGCLCDECYKAEQAAKRAEANAKNAEKNAEAGLPALTGTEKQVAWAETIRASQAEELNKLLKKIEENARANPKAAEIGKMIIAEVLQRSAATDWIDSRNAVYDGQWAMTNIKKRL